MNAFKGICRGVPKKWLNDDSGCELLLFIRRKIANFTAMLPSCAICLNPVEITGFSSHPLEGCGHLCHDICENNLNYRVDCGVCFIPMKPEPFEDNHSPVIDLVSADIHEI